MTGMEIEGAIMFFRTGRARTIAFNDPWSYLLPEVSICAFRSQPRVAAIPAIVGFAVTTIQTS